jgi:hypothetical protein
VAAASEEAEMAAHNRSIEPLLDYPTASGVVAVSVPKAYATECADFLHRHWVDGKLTLPRGNTCFGYSSYSKTLSKHDKEQQRLDTLLVSNAKLPAMRETVPGFSKIEMFLVDWLGTKYGTVVELWYAHGLRQGPLTLKSTGFDVHQDTGEPPPPPRRGGA